MIEYMVQDLVEIITETQCIEYDIAMCTIYDVIDIMRKNKINELI